MNYIKLRTSKHNKSKNSLDLFRQENDVISFNALRTELDNLLTKLQAEKQRLQNEKSMHERLQAHQGSATMGGLGLKSIQTKITAYQSVIKYLDLFKDYFKNSNGNPNENLYSNLSKKLQEDNDAIKKMTSELVGVLATELTQFIAHFLSLNPQSKKIITPAARAEFEKRLGEVIPPPGHNAGDPKVHGKPPATAAAADPKKASPGSAGIGGGDRPDLKKEKDMKEGKDAADLSPAAKPAASAAPKPVTVTPIIAKPSAIQGQAAQPNASAVPDLFKGPKGDQSNKGDQGSLSAAERKALIAEVKGSAQEDMDSLLTKVEKLSQQLAFVIRDREAEKAAELKEKADLVAKFAKEKADLEARLSAETAARVKADQELAARLKAIEDANVAQAAQGNQLAPLVPLVPHVAALAALPALNLNVNFPLLAPRIAALEANAANAGNVMAEVRRLEQRVDVLDKNQDENIKKAVYLAHSHQGANIGKPLPTNPTTVVVPTPPVHPPGKKKPQGSF